MSQLKTFFSKPRNIIRVAALVLLLAGTYGQLMLRRAAAPVVDSKRYAVALAFTTAAGETRRQVQVGDADTVRVATDGPQKLTAAFLLTAAGPETVRLDGGFGCDGASVRPPPLTARLGAPTAIEPPDQGGAAPCALVVVVTKLPSVN